MSSGARPPTPTAVLLHSPLVGPATMAPLAADLGAGGWDVAVPDLRAATAASADFQAAVIEAATPGAVVVGFSGAGAFLPALAGRAARTIYLDALVPGSGPTTSPSGGFIGFIDALPRDGGLLPPWHAWFPDAIAAAVPDESALAALVADMPRLPRSFFDGAIPLPDRWWSRPSAYLQLSPGYDEHRARAEGYGWPVRRHEGGHLDVVTRPALVARLLRELAPDPSRPDAVGDT